MPLAKHVPRIVIGEKKASIFVLFLRIEVTKWKSSSLNFSRKDKVKEYKIRRNIHFV